jgi:two-component system sensor histidine kinase KdpD
VPGSPRLKRWEDVHVLLDAGIDVLTTMNVQHLESLNDQIWQSTGVRVRETIPDWVLKPADEVVMVDLTPRALIDLHAE